MSLVSTIGSPNYVRRFVSGAINASTIDIINTDRFRAGTVVINVIMAMAIITAH